MTDPKAFQPGDPVWYSPSLGGRRYAAVVAGPVRMLGSTPVLPLRALEPAYARDHHPGTGRSTVAAACIDAVDHRAADPAETERLQAELGPLEAARVRAELAAVTPGSQWRHHTGTIYEVLHIANLESARLDEYPVLVVYRRVEDGSVWARRLYDWHRSMAPIAAGEGETT